MDNLIGQQIPLGLVLVFLQNWLKQQKWFPWLNYQSVHMNHAFAILTSGLATFGLLGLFLGPVIMAALLTVWREWIVPVPEQKKLA